MTYEKDGATPFILHTYSFNSPVIKMTGSKQLSQKTPLGQSPELVKSILQSVSQSDYLFIYDLFLYYFHMLPGLLSQ